MSSYLGIDIQAAHGVASRLHAWSALFDELSGQVARSELIAEISANSVATLAVARNDLHGAGVAIRSAADQLSSFTLQLDAPFALAEAVAKVQAFDGSENDPELDRLLAALRDQVEAEGADDPAAVLAALLDTDRSGDIRLRDLAHVERARLIALTLGDLAGSGEISDNDPRIDQALAALREALAGHVPPDQVGAVMAALVAPGHRHIDTAAQMASTLTGFDLQVVRLAHRAELDYVVAASALLAARIDRLTEQIAEGAAPDATAFVAWREREELLVELLGSDDPTLVAVLVSMLDRGTTIQQALAGLDDELARQHQEVVNAIAEHFDIEATEALEVVAQLHAQTEALVLAGWNRNDAEAAVFIAHERGFDIDAIVSVAETETLGSLSEAVVLTAAAQTMGMSVWEYRAFRGLDEYFNDFDSAIDGIADGVVSIADIEYVAANPLSHSAELVAVAKQLLFAGALRARLDTALRNDDVLGTGAFGAVAHHDFKISRADVDAFILKQSINSLLAPHLGEIDIADKGGEPDDRYSGDDLATYLELHGHELTPIETQAITTLLENGWHYENWWEAHGSTVALVAAVAAGIAVAAALGPGAPVVLGLIQTGSAAAATAGVVTMAGNALSGESLDEDAYTNMYKGLFAGWSGAGFQSVTLAGLSVKGKVVTVLGVSSDALWVASEILDDPYFDAIDPDNSLQDALGVAGIATGAGAAATTLALRGKLAEESAGFAVDEIESAILGNNVDAAIRSYTTAEALLADDGDSEIFDVDAALDELLVDLGQRSPMEISTAPTTPGVPITVDRLLEDLAVPIEVTD